MLFHPNHSLKYVYNNIDLPFIPIIVEMIDEGVRIDIDRLHNLSDKISERLLELESDINLVAGRNLNINSNKQMVEFLYHTLSLPRHPSKKKRKSADAAVLEFLRPHHIVISHIMEYRKLEKLKGDFADKLITMVGLDGKIHPQINNTRVETGRLSMSNPNFQQIPKRTEPWLPEFIVWAIKEVRKSIVAPPGYKIVKFDQSQVEFRIMVVLGNDEATIKAINNKVDIHSEPLAIILNLSYDEVVRRRKNGDKVIESYRDFMKNVVYGQAYGQTPQGLFEKSRASGLPITYEQIPMIQNIILGMRPGIRRYISEAKELARVKGYAETYFGRRVYYPELLSLDTPRWKRDAIIDREAINAPIQGTSAEILKITGRRIWDERRLRKMRSRFMLQVHDEMVSIVPDEEVEDFAGMVYDIQPKVMNDWPLLIEAEVSVGDNWGEVEKI